MKALTICQPYAELIACGEKRVENRTWSTSYRGPLAIHAGTSRAWLHTYRPLPKQMDFGKVIAVCDLTACFSLADLKYYADLSNSGRASGNAFERLKNYGWTQEFLWKFGWVLWHNHASGPFCWVLENVRRIDPVRAVGRQGLWNWEASR